MILILANPPWHTARLVVWQQTCSTLKWRVSHLWRQRSQRVMRQGAVLAAPVKQVQDVHLHAVQPFTALDTLHCSGLQKLRCRGAKFSPINCTSSTLVCQHT